MSRVKFSSAIPNTAACSLFRLSDSHRIVSVLSVRVRQTVQSVNNMNKKNDTRILPGHEYIPGLDDYELKPDYDLDYSKAKPNPFAGHVKYTRPHGGARNGAGRKPVAEPAERHTVTLYKKDVKYLRKLDANLSRAIRKLIQAKVK